MTSVVGRTVCTIGAFYMGKYVLYKESKTFSLNFEGCRFTPISLVLGYLALSISAFFVECVTTPIYSPIVDAMCYYPRHMCAERVW